MRKTATRLLALLWRGLVWWWLTLVFGVFVNLFASYLFEGKQDFKNTPISLIFLWILTHQGYSILILTAVIILTLFTYLADRSQRRALQTTTKPVILAFNKLSRE